MNKQEVEWLLMPWSPTSSDTFKLSRVRSLGENHRYHIDISYYMMSMGKTLWENSRTDILLYN